MNIYQNCLNQQHARFSDVKFYLYIFINYKQLRKKVVLKVNKLGNKNIKYI